MRITLKDGTAYSILKASRNLDLISGNYQIHLTLNKSDNLVLEDLAAKFTDENLETVTINRDSGDLTYTSQTLEFLNEDYGDAVNEIYIVLKDLTEEMKAQRAADAAMVNAEL